MSLRSSMTIVASPRPRVGKTLLARLLVDFHLHNGRPIAASTSTPTTALDAVYARAYARRLTSAKFTGRWHCSTG